MRLNKNLIICALIVFALYHCITSYRYYLKYCNILNEYSIQQEKLESYSISIRKLSATNATLYQHIKTLENQHTTTNNELLAYIEPLKDSNKLLYLEIYKEIKNVLPLEEYFTTEQINIMCRCIETETYQCEFDGKVNVASVILNRVEHELYPTDPIEIITSPLQFAYYRTEISDDTLLALEYAIYIGDTTNGCIGFRSDICPEVWNGWTYQFQDNAVHYFYK